VAQPVPSARGAAGHRVGPHTADCVIEAWGPDRPACLTEALLALVEVFAVPEAEAPVRVVPLWVEPAPVVDILVSLLEDAIYVNDVIGVPVRFHLVDTDNGGVCGYMEVVDPSQVDQVGPIPKGVSYHDIDMAVHDGEWSCRVVIDV